MRATISEVRAGSQERPGRAERSESRSGALDGPRARSYGGQGGATGRRMLGSRRVRPWRRAAAEPSSADRPGVRPDHRSAQPVSSPRAPSAALPVALVRMILTPDHPRRACLPCCWESKRLARAAGRRTGSQHDPRTDRPWVNRRRGGSEAAIARRVRCTCTCESLVSGLLFIVRLVDARCSHMTARARASHGCSASWRVVAQTCHEF